MTHAEKVELTRRLRAIEEKEQSELLATAEGVWSACLLPLLTESRQKFPGGSAPVTLTLQHRQHAYRSGLQGGGVWILRWNSYQAYMNCSGDAEPETFGFASLDELMSTAEQEHALCKTLPGLGVQYTIQMAGYTHPMLKLIRDKCSEIQSACKGLRVQGQTIYPQQISQVDWRALKEKSSFTGAHVNKAELRTALIALGALIEALPSSSDSEEAPGKTKRGTKRAKSHTQHN